MNREGKSSRRNTLRLVAGAALAGVSRSVGRIAQAADVASAPKSLPLPSPELRRLILVVFGGGTRASETIDDAKHRHIPRLWNELIPRGTLLTNVRVERRVVHPNCNGSIKTGHWEWDDLDWFKPLAHPTIFEIARKHRALPDTAAWSFVYAAILANTGRSTALGYGDAFAANIVQPPTIPRTVADDMERRMAAAAATGSTESELAVAADCARLARETSRVDASGLQSDAARAWFDQQFRDWRRATGTTSHDAFLANCAMACMERFSPVVMTVDFGEIDCAHLGSWSRYLAAIRRTDALTCQLWETAQRLPDYRDRTLMLVLPDHGRELEQSGGTGFIHHSDFYTGERADEGCRRVWMLTIGPGIVPRRTIDRPVPITAAAATGLQYLGLEASPGAASAALDFG